MEVYKCTTYEASFSMHRYEFIDGSMFLPEKFSISLSDGEVIALGYNECMALCTLLEYKNEFVMRKLLIKNIWGDRGVLVDENSLNQCISRLRKQINNTVLRAIVHIETLPKVGYKIEIATSLSKDDIKLAKSSDVGIIDKSKHNLALFVFISFIIHLLIIFYHDEIVDLINRNDVVSIIIQDNENIEKGLRSNGKAMMVYCEKGTLSSEKNSYYSLSSN
ncbi:winged helix-turn-helix domain-containing protein [Vibrio sp.]|uniref:winged helix-turn-helix domain-containing protein n=1 Tax=Vibrio sp. TaxID=678 RepID=UPI003AA9D0F0